MRVLVVSLILFLFVGCESEAEKEKKRKKAELIEKLKYESDSQCGLWVVDMYMQSVKKRFPHLKKQIEDTVNPDGNMTSYYKKRLKDRYPEYVKKLKDAFTAKLCEDDKKIIDYRKELLKSGKQNSTPEETKSMSIKFGNICSKSFMKECSEVIFYAKEACSKIKTNTKEHEDCMNLKLPSKKQSNDLAEKYFEAYRTFNRFAEFKLE